MNTKVGNLIYKGKAKDVYETEDDQKVIVKFRDDITAGDGAKKESLSEKGFYNSIISSKFFEVLEEAGVKTQYIELLEPSYMLSKKLEMIPLEVITRNIAAGSLLKRFPFEEKQEFEPPIIQIDYKNDEFHDPMLNEDIIIALGLATAEDLATIREITLKINSIVKNFLKERGILFPDFKIEFGRDSEGNIVLGDEISPDTCRFWDMKTWDVLDKDLFRKGESGVMDAYKTVASRILDEEDKKKWNLNI
ncbi:phosphoribosylaminoimidazolesuccinocarboxamide synthase [Methanobacterium congolense]|uniref:Phosphoribosylaminoimidazole-succinocarboxamide synthase n=1 Tax=Methanobacterium congolense TaxID=118062 RepID=A0A1D3L0G9_9EURY|nr:phosphoribosylaminoimidazolesuccinocarboxamide synthase [Methanobacterium congolense]SCG85085.1 Phosphoribosylaminoimidazole-succinocarboxamidesynthase [Methanobacterium congolense]